MFLLCSYFDVLWCWSIHQCSSRLLQWHCGLFDILIVYALSSPYLRGSNSSCYGKSSQANPVHVHIDGPGTQWLIWSSDLYSGSLGSSGSQYTTTAPYSIVFFVTHRLGLGLLISLSASSLSLFPNMIAFLIVLVPSAGFVVGAYVPDPYICGTGTRESK